MYEVRGTDADGQVMALPGASFGTEVAAREFRDWLRLKHPDAHVWLHADGPIEDPWA